MAVSQRKRVTIFMSSFIVTALLMVNIYWEGDWLPGKQIKREILENPTQPLQLTSESRSILDSIGLSLGDVRYFIQHGDVNFPPIEREPCRKYLIEFTDDSNQDEFAVTVRICKEEVPGRNDEGAEGMHILEPVYLDNVLKNGVDYSVRN
jgi:hypothetical protein